MRSTRLIPLILIHNGSVVKSIRFTNYVYVGDPINTIRLFNDLEVDEIIVLDIDASKSNKKPDLKTIENLTSEAFMPFAYGGGITSVALAEEILQCGVEKIVLNHAIQNSLSLIAECAERFGSQSVVASIDYKKKIFGGYACYDHVSEKILINSVEQSAISCSDYGAGEIMINSVDRDGMMNGFDAITIQSIAQSIDVPLIALGGAGNLEHVKSAEIAGASAIAAGSIFLFHGKQRGILVSYPKENILRKYLH